jgi:glycine dehydrogenase subunit 2
MAALRAACEEHGDCLVGMMLTNPNTLGLFDENVEEVADLVHGVGGLLYGDGANMNALLGIARPGDLGFDVLHYNLHKTFSTPHGGGGPGSGPVGASERLAEFLPAPVVGVDPEESDDESLFYTFVDPLKSIGRVKAFYGHFGVMVRAYAYIRMLGAEGLRRVAEYAVLNANYLKERVKDTYPVPYDRICMHEFVCEGRLAGAPYVHALDVSKRLIDYGFHPPTNYFPLIVPEALMIEPTETESKDTLDAFADALLRIAEEARTEPDLLHEAPRKAPVRRLDEVRAAKDLTLRWEPD